MRAAIVLLGIFWSTALCAQAAQPCVGDEGLSDATHLSELREAAVRVKVVQCSGGSQDEVTQAFVEFIEGNQDWFARFGGFENDLNPMAVIKQTLAAGRTYDIPSIGISLNDELQIGAAFFAPASMATCQARAAPEACPNVFDEFIEYYTHAHTAYATPPRLAFVQGLKALSGEWDRYLTASRGFTTLEMAFNSAMYKRNESVDFQNPPDIQWILLHPNIVIENVDDAADGNNVEEAIVVDIFGMNWWRQDKWYMPTGFAVTGVYSDRPEVQDWGYGASLFFDSVYTVGYSNHDGDHGVYVSFDLLKLFQDKEQVYDRLVSRLREN